MSDPLNTSIKEEGNVLPQGPEIKKNPQGENKIEENKIEENQIKNNEQKEDEPKKVQQAEDKNIKKEEDQSEENKIKGVDVSAPDAKIEEEQEKLNTSSLDIKIKEDQKKEDPQKLDQSPPEDKSKENQQAEEQEKLNTSIIEIKEEGNVLPQGPEIKKNPQGENKIEEIEIEEVQPGENKIEEIEIEEVQPGENKIEEIKLGENKKEENQIKNNEQKEDEQKKNEQGENDIREILKLIKEDEPKKDELKKDQIVENQNSQPRESVNNNALRQTYHALPRGIVSNIWPFSKFDLTSKQKFVRIGDETSNIQAPDTKGDVEINKKIDGKDVRLTIGKNNSLRFELLEEDSLFNAKRKQYIKINKDGDLQFELGTAKGKFQQLHELLSDKEKNDYNNPLLKFLTNFTEIRQTGNKYNVRLNEDIRSSVVDFRKIQKIGEKNNIDSSKINENIANKNIAELKKDFNSILPSIVKSKENSNIELGLVRKNIIISNKDDSLEKNLKKKYKEISHQKIVINNTINEIFLIPTESPNKSSKNFIERVEMLKKSLPNDIVNNPVFIPISQKANKENLFNGINQGVIDFYKKQECLFDKKLNIETRRFKKDKVISSVPLITDISNISSVPLITDISNKSEEEKSEREKYDELKAFLIEAYPTSDKDYNKQYCEDLRKEYLAAYIECKNAVIKEKYDDYEKNRYKMMAISSQVMLDSSRDNANDNVKSLLSTISSINTQTLDKNAKGVFLAECGKLSKLFQTSDDEILKDSAQEINSGGNIKYGRVPDGHQICVQKNLFNNHYSEAIFATSDNELKIKDGKDFDSTKIVTLTTCPSSIKDSGLVIDMFGRTKDVTKENAPETNSFDKRHCPITLTMDDVKLLGKIYSENQDELLKKLKDKNVINLVDILEKATPEQKNTGLIDRVKAGFELAGVKYNLVADKDVGQKKGGFVEKITSKANLRNSAIPEKTNAQALVADKISVAKVGDYSLNCNGRKFKTEDILEYLSKPESNGGHKFSKNLIETAKLLLDEYNKEGSNKPEIVRNAANLLFSIKAEQKSIAEGLKDKEIIKPGKDR